MICKSFKHFNSNDFLIFLITDQFTTGAELDWRGIGGAELGGVERYPTDFLIIYKKKTKNRKKKKSKKGEPQTSELPKTINFIVKTI
jgi:hypothetical protein